jgi:hypothetical protein
MVGTSGGVRWWVCGVEQENGTFAGCVADLRVISGFGKRHCKGVGMESVDRCGFVGACHLRWDAPYMFAMWQNGIDVTPEIGRALTARGKFPCRPQCRLQHAFSSSRRALSAADYPGAATR